MNRFAWWLPAVVLMGGVCFLTIARARDDDDEKAKMKAAQAAEKDVEGLADAVGKPDALKKQADVIAKKYDELLPIMWQMKPVERGGMKIKGAMFPNDSIELELLALGKKLPASGIAAEAPAYTRMAQVIHGIAAVTPSYASKFAKNAADEKVWDGLAADMAKGSDDLAAAVKNNDAAAFKKAVNNLNHSCNECHTKFRDN